MQAQDLTATGMENGVSQSRNVVLFLSSGYMGRPFCLKELRWAIHYKCIIIGTRRTVENSAAGEEVLPIENADELPAVRLGLAVFAGLLETFAGLEIVTGRGDDVAAGHDELAVVNRQVALGADALALLGIEVAGGVVLP